MAEQSTDFVAKEETPKVSDKGGETEGRERERKNNMTFDASPWDLHGKNGRDTGLFVVV